ncbi:MAG: DUF2953 domain-containing protein [Clostridia bacterium]|nr:DUF2953 domain-containing protein [Clostridia bacterium]
MDEFIKYAVILLILFAVIFWRASIICVCKNGVSLKLRTCFINITLVDTINKKTPKKSKYTKKAIEKREKKAQKKAEKALLKKQQKAAEKAARKEAEKAGTAEPKKKKFNFKFPDDVEDLLDALSTLFGELLLPIVQNARIRFKKFELTVAASDPADTAIRYGIISQAAAYFLTILSENAKLSNRQLAKVKINSDFLAEKTTIDLDMSVTFGIWKLLYVIIRGLLKVLIKLLKFKAKKSPDEKSEKKNKKHKIC